MISRAGLTCSALAFAVMTGLAAVSPGQTGQAELRPFPREGFIPPQVCGGCHPELFDMWTGTMHARAFDDPLFRAASKRFAAETETAGERADAEHCVACHNPIAYRSGQIPGSSADYGATDEVTAHAVSCDFCHTVSEIVEPGNASFNNDPGTPSNPGVKRGPRDDAEPMYHRAAYSAIHVSSAFCGACHNVTHRSYGTKLESTYDEWLAGPYNSPDPAGAVTCQDCHMRQSPGNPATGMTARPDYPGKATPMSRERPHIYRHNLAGANVFLPQMWGDSAKAGLAEERLRHAATLEIRDAGPDANGGWGFTVRVRNEGAGHMLPTGVTEYRQMWLEVTVTDGRGTRVFASGMMADDGSIPADARLFHTVLGDSEGKPTINVARAATILSDRRVPPKGFLDERFTLKRPSGGALAVTAALRYRSLDPGVAALLLGNPVPVPVITMAETAADIGN